MKINCIVINDSNHQAASIRKYIDQRPELNLVHMTNSSTEALKFLENNKIDLIMRQLPECKSYRSFFFADVNGRRQKINHHEVVYVESAGNYVLVVGKTWKVMVYKSMQLIMELLPSECFVRIHKSFIISIDFIDSIKGNSCILRWDTEKRTFPIGNSFKRNFLDILKIAV